MRRERLVVVARRPVRLSVPVLVFLLLARSPVLRAEATPGQLAYLAGVRAYEVADYTTAVSKMREALRDDGTEGLRRFRASGLKEEDYLPHFFLGLSLEKLGARQEALAELRESERQGAVRGKPGSLRLLEAAIVRLSPPLSRVLETPSPVPLPPVRETVPATPVPLVPTPFPAPVGTATGEPAAAEAPRPANPPVRTRPPATFAPVPALPSSTGERQAQLREGLRAFFRAEYGQATVRLEPIAGVDTTARAFLAFSLAGRYLLEGRRDTELLARARAEYGAVVAVGWVLSSPELIPEAIRETLGRR